MKFMSYMEIVNNINNITYCRWYLRTILILMWIRISFL